jgi:hypothetical protein
VAKRHRRGRPDRPLRAVVVAALLLAMAGCGDSEETRSVQAPQAGECGQKVRERGDRRLTVTASFPEPVTGSGFEGTVTITNDSDRRIEGLAASQPDVYVTRAGTIVATPLPRDDVGLALDLAPGAAREFRTMGSLRHCVDQAPLGPGRYEVHAVLRIAGAGAAVGGPWPLEVA